MNNTLAILVLLRSLTQQFKLQLQNCILNNQNSTKAAWTGLSAAWMVYLLGVCSTGGLLKIFCSVIAILGGCSVVQSREIVRRTERQLRQIESIHYQVEANLLYQESLFHSTTPLPWHGNSPSQNHPFH